MTKVFIGGSRRISRLNSGLVERIDNIVQKGFTILVGDANGADKSVQMVLAEKRYGKVIVFCMGTSCRNNVGGWKANNVPDIPGKKDFQYYSRKDAEMAREADFGFMIWDAKSKGTLNNILNLLRDHKKVLVYFEPDKSFHNVSTWDDLVNLLERCDKATLNVFEEKLGLSRYLGSEKGQKVMEFTPT